MTELDIIQKLSWITHDYAHIYNGHAYNTIKSDGNLNFGHDYDYDYDCDYGYIYANNANKVSRTSIIANNKVWNPIDSFRQLLLTFVMNLKRGILVTDQQMENTHQLIKEEKCTRKKIKKNRNKKIKKDIGTKNNMTKIEKLARRHFRNIFQKKF